MGKKKTKKISGAEKTELKTAKKIGKQIAKEVMEKGEDDIETLLLKSSKLNDVDKVIEIKCEPPSPRCNMTLNAHHEKDILFMFGGEFSNGKETNVYNDLYVYHINLNAWTQLMVPNPPPPRCSHQAVVMPQLGGQLWIFGGEFLSPSQTQFHHYNELWCFHLTNYSWEKIKVVGGPSARSGHRMVSCKKLLVLFGGFYDNSKEFKYFNDVHIFNVETFLWLKLNISGIPPSPRSGCVLVSTQDQRNIVIYGGYSKEHIKKDEDKGIIYTDMYMLSMEKRKDNIDDYVNWRWINIKQSGDKPTPRCSMSIVVSSSNKAVLFGGVNDEEENEEKLKSNFYNDMYRLEIDKGNWHKIDLTKTIHGNIVKKRRRKAKDKNSFATISITDEAIMLSDEEKSDYFDNDDVDKNIKKLKVKEEVSQQRDSCHLNDEKDEENIFKVTFNKVEHASNTLYNASPLEVTDMFIPSPRMRPMLAAKRGILYLYGGIFEDVKDRVVTLSDFYSIDMQKLDKWNIIIPQILQSMNLQESSDEETSSSDDGDSSDDIYDDDNESTDEDSILCGPEKYTNENFENYLTRTEEIWLEKAIILAKKENIKANEKLIKKAATRMAKEYWQKINI